jgi:Protein of unknown function (DUF2459)
MRLARISALRIIFGLALFILPHELLAAADEVTGTIYVARRGWHVDVGYSARDLREPLRSLAAKLPKADYFFFGFGDKHYLDDEKNQHGPRMLAALWPGAGIVLVTTLSAPPADAFGEAEVIAFPANPQQLTDSQEFIRNTLRAGEAGTDVYRAGPYKGSYYFLAVPRYSAFHTCNTWAAQALRAASYPVHAQGVLLARQVWSQARRIQRQTTTAKPQ